MRLRLGFAVMAFTALVFAAPGSATLPIGPQFRVSHMGPDGDTSFAARPAAVAYNSLANQYLVVWSGADTTVGEYEIWAQVLDAFGGPLGGEFRVSAMGPDGSAIYFASGPAVTYNPQANEYLVVWRADDNTAPIVNDEFEIYGQRLAASGAETGADDFRISDMGPDGTSAYSAANPDVAYNTQANEYLVIWSGDDDTAPLVDGEREIFGQRLAASGAEIGANDFRVSDMGPDGAANYEATDPALAYNGQANEYVAVWEGDDDIPPLVDAEHEIFGQRLAAAGTEVGPNDFRISDVGPNGSTGFAAGASDISYNGQANEYLVVWAGDDDTPPLVDDEYEVFGQRLAAAGTEVGANDFRVSDMGPDGNTTYGAESVAVVANAPVGEYLVVWWSDGDTAPLVNGEYEIFGQRFTGSGAETGTNDFRISQMGPDGNAGFGGETPAAAYGSTPNEYLVAWHGDTDAAPAVDNEVEIWARPPAPARCQPPDPARSRVHRATMSSPARLATTGSARWEETTLSLASAETTRSSSAQATTAASAVGAGMRSAAAPGQTGSPEEEDGTACSASEDATCFSPATAYAISCMGGADSTVRASTGAATPDARSSVSSSHANQDRTRLGIALARPARRDACAGNASDRAAVPRVADGPGRRRELRRVDRGGGVQLAGEPVPGRLDRLEYDIG